MSDWGYAVILGVIEGLTEFIPVSSTGHLLLAKTFMGLPDGFWDTFAVLIQLGAILGVVALYFHRLWNVLIGLPTDPAARRFAISVLVAFAPAVVIGFALHDIIKQVLFESPRLICWSLIIGGAILLVIDRWSPAPRHHDAMKTPLVTAFGVGLVQCLAMIPGVSRSGATIVGGVMMGMDKRAATEFSFFLAIPTMVGAFAYDFYKNRGSIDLHQGEVIALGFAVSFVSGLIVVRYMLDFVQKRGLGAFGWWRIAVGAAGLIALALR
ncbi:undecaprenyl-diphosphate phosphatase [Phenylobacterium sp.]|uniref:undecaprenyl-diphosphate phosphatase n=1 Tax=Phenylobacterium sp. TaxID=1871053 RepID=UPI0035AE5014